MDRINFLDELVDFCLYNNIFNKSISVEQIRSGIEHNLDDADFVESLINQIILKTKQHRHINTDSVKMLLLELEKIRLELEY